MKIFKHRNILGFIYSLFLLLPFLNVLGRVCYATVNKNAYLSYSGQEESYIKQDETFLYYDLRGEEVQPNNNFILVSSDTNTGSFFEFFGSTDVSSILFRLHVKFTLVRGSVYIEDNDLDGCYVFPFENDVYFSYVLTNSTTYTYGLALTVNGITYRPTIPFIEFYDTAVLKISSDEFVGQDFDSFNEPYYKMWREYSFPSNLTFSYFEKQVSYQLDNAFEYSLKKITNNNLGNVKWFNFIGNLFLDDNSQNNLYINFINWYMNYALLVSVVYVLFMVLMWFIQWIRRLLERGLDKFGGGGSY